MSGSELLPPLHKTSTSKKMALDNDYNDSYYDYIDCIDMEYEYEYEYEIKPSFHLFVPVCCCLIVCISIPANSLLLWALLRERAWKTASDILLLQLTISDLFFTVSLPFEAYQILHGWIFGYVAYKVLRGVFLLGLNSYVLILTAMTRYNYVTVVHASCLSEQGSKKLYVVISSLIWLVCAGISINVSLNSEVSCYGFGHTACSGASDVMLYSDIYQHIVLLFLIPFIIMLCCCVCMWIKQCRIRGQRQASRLITGMVVVFFICLAPYNIRHFIVSLEMLRVLKISHEWVQTWYYAHRVFYTLLLSHCCFNPLFHVFRTQMFRRQHPRPCGIVFQRRDEIQNSSTELICPHDSSV